MNKRDIRTIKSGIIKYMLPGINPTKTIYIVKCDEVHYMPNSGFSRKNTYNLIAFENLEDAKIYMHLAYKCIVKPLITNSNFRIMFDTFADELKPESDNIMCKRDIKLIGNNEINYSQTKLFTFIVERIDFKPISIGHE